MANKESQELGDSTHEGRDDAFMDIDRMVNEGLGGGNVSPHNGLIQETTTCTMEFPDSLPVQEQPNNETR